MTIAEVERVLFVGAGQMGCANSLVAAVSGYDTVLTDAIPTALESVRGRHDEIGAFLVASGYCTAQDLDAARPRVSVEADLDLALAGVDLVSESIVEDVEAKRELFARLDRLSDERAILTTNTSTLLVSEIEDVLTGGDRFAALHSHLGSLLFDIVAGPRTSAETVDVLQRYVLSLDGVPLTLQNEHRGYVFNALNGGVLATALQLVVDGEADEAAVDRAWMSSRGAPMGPFGMIDLFGIDLVITAWRRPGADPWREQLRPRVEPFLASFVDAGHLGMKTGRGFYDYPEPAYQAPGFLDAAVDEAAADALTTSLICGAAHLARIEVASRGDIDLAWRAATGLDAGPFLIATRLGPQRLRAMVDAQVGRGLVSPAAADEVAAVLA